MPKGKAEAVPLPADVQSIPNNGGLEAISELPDGRLITVTEGWRNEEHDLKGWLKEGAGWSDITYAATEDFVPTDFTLLPSGDLLALERRYTPITGPAARLQIVEAEHIVGGARLVGREVAQIWLPLTVDNMEGIAAIERSGRTYIYMVSDDNFSPLQRTLLMMFELIEDQ